MIEVATKQELRADRMESSRGLASKENGVQVDFATEERFTPTIRELMLAQPLNAIKSVGFKVLKTKKVV